MLGATAAAALPIAAVAMPTLACQAGVEPIIGVLRRATALRVLIDHIDTEDDAGDAAFDEMSALVDDAADLTITTPAGALAALEWARGEFAFAHVDKAQPDHLDVVTLRFLDGVLGVLRAVVTGDTP